MSPFSGKAKKNALKAIEKSGLEQVTGMLFPPDDRIPVEVPIGLRKGSAGKLLDLEVEPYLRATVAQTDIRSFDLDLTDDERGLKGRLVYCSRRWPRINAAFERMVGRGACWIRGPVLFVVVDDETKVHNVKPYSFRDYCIGAAGSVWRQVAEYEADLAWERLDVPPEDLSELEKEVEEYERSVLDGQEASQEDDKPPLKRLRRG